MAVEFISLAIHIISGGSDSEQRWDNFNDAIDLGRYVLPLVRQELAHREATGRGPILNPDSKPEAVFA